jgi:pyruvate,water dikinase
LKADLYGVCGAPGVAEGPARVVLTYEHLGEVKPGEILVAPTTGPSWTPVFGIIKGAVVDRGGTLSHASVVGREHGIPVAIQVFEGTKKITTGQRIRVNGTEGTVYILE